MHSASLRQLATSLKRQLVTSLAGNFKALLTWQYELGQLWQPDPLPARQGGITHSPAQVATRL
jgi:hypothetical protein